MEHRAVRRARQHLLERLTENVTLDDLVELTQLSRFHLLRVFTRSEGVPPHEFVLLARIARARVLLETGHGIGDVALDLGFADQSHFGRHFKRLVGTSPGVYAAKVRPSAGGAQSL